MPALSSISLCCRTSSLVGSSTASRRLSTVIGSITSRYLPLTYRSRSTSSATLQMKFEILFSCESCIECLSPACSIEWNNCSTGEVPTWEELQEL